jgi:lipopolysaccharide/colanic/teichoic acid biosynthesis glycosyltransferase
MEIIMNSDIYAKGIYRTFIKRSMDIILSLFALIVLSPIIMIISLLVRIKLGKPVLFKQKRPGLFGKKFIIYKFRTMTEKRDKQGVLLSDEIRLTGFGKFLRSTSLDELPELFNILIGDMSIVGPRPQLIKDLIFMNEEQNKRHSVLPGLTGLAQVNGRNNITWEDKFKYDNEYITSISFMGDLKIILKTIENVFKREGISTEGMATAEDYGDYLLRNNIINEDEYYSTIEKYRSLSNV